MVIVHYLPSSMSVAQPPHLLQHDGVAGAVDGGDQHLPAHAHAVALAQLHIRHVDALRKEGRRCHQPIIRAAPCRGNS